VYKEILNAWCRWVKFEHVPWWCISC
jgi:hypothetical protein